MSQKPTEDSDSTARQSRREGAEGKRSFGDMLFGPYHSGREEMVLQYIIHRFGDGARLEDVVQEEFVRRYASPAEIEDILDDPRLVEAARKKMEEDFSSGRLDPRKATRRVAGNVAEWLPERL